MLAKKIKAVIFDVGGVLQIKKQNRDEGIKGVHKEVAEKFNISLDHYFDAVDDVYAKSIEGKLQEREVLKRLALNFKISQKKLIKVYKEVYTKNFNLNKELLDYAEKIKKQKIKIAILSDMWHLSKDTLIIKKFYKVFNPLIISCDVGMRKPNKEIYKLILRKLHTNPEETIFIDDREWNIKSAKEIGIKTILFEDNKKTMNLLEKLLK